MSDDTLGYAEHKAAIAGYHRSPASSRDEIRSANYAEMAAENKALRREFAELKQRHWLLESEHKRIVARFWPMVDGLKAMVAAFDGGGFMRRRRVRARLEELQRLGGAK